MNVEQANAISLSKILEQIGSYPVKKADNDFWYFSPLEPSHFPQFYVNAAKNIWLDFSSSKGGKVIDFVCAYLKTQQEDHTVSDALRWLDNMQPQHVLLPLPEPSNECNGMSLTLRKVAALQHPSLLNFLESKGLSLPLAKKYLKEVIVQNAGTEEEFYALGLPNEDGGFEIRNQIFKGRIAPKGISLLRGSKQLPEDVHIFKNFFDFLSVLAYQKTDSFEGDVIILHSVSFLPQALPYIKNYTYKNVYSWLDNDAVGLKTVKSLTAFATRHRDLTVTPMNKIYMPHKDVTAWHKHMLAL